jgi:hypothetical protein
LPSKPCLGPGNMYLPQLRVQRYYRNCTMPSGARMRICFCQTRTRVCHYTLLSAKFRLNLDFRELGARILSCQEDLVVTYLSRERAAFVASECAQVIYNVCEFINVNCRSGIVRLTIAVCYVRGAFMPPITLIIMSVSSLLNNLVDAAIVVTRKRGVPRSGVRTIHQLHQKPSRIHLHRDPKLLREQARCRY